MDGYDCHHRFYVRLGYAMLFTSCSLEFLNADRICLEYFTHIESAMCIVITRAQNCTIVDIVIIWGLGSVIASIVLLLLQYIKYITNSILDTYVYLYASLSNLPFM